MNSEIDSLNKKFTTLSPLDRLKALFDSFDEKKILTTSSFGGTSVILLHMISKVKPGFPVHFVDTGYHFEETLVYKKQLEESLNIRIIDVKAEERRHLFTQQNETWRYNQDLCCFVNKVNPVDELKSNYDIWISGLLRFQNENRRKMRVFEPKADIIKFHPILDMTKDEVGLYSKIYDLPIHPMVNQGYDSIGCTHCTMKGEGRSGRWFNTSKTECGLHV